MRTLREAIEVAEERKAAVVGNDAHGIFSPTEEGDRLIFSGLDVDYEEMQELALRVGANFSSMAAAVPLQTLFTTCWVEGLLVGMLTRDSSEVST